MEKVTKNVVNTSGDSNPTAGATGDGAPASQEGEKGRVISYALPESFAAPVIQITQADAVFVSNDGVFGLTESSGTLKAGDLGKVADLLDDSNKLMQKCSLNDIMFLIMLVMTKAAADQRESRYEGIISRKNIAAHTAQTVFEAKMSDAMKTYKAEKKDAELQKIMGIVSVVGGAVSVVSSAASAVGSGIGSAINSVFNAITKVLKAIFRPVINMVKRLLSSGAMQAATKMLTETINRVRSCITAVSQYVSRIFSPIISILKRPISQIISILKHPNVSRYFFQALSMTVNAVGTIASGALRFQIAGLQKEAAFVRAEADRTKALFDFNMRQISDLKEAYSVSSRNVRSILNSLREVLQKNQEARLSITRNI